MLPPFNFVVSYAVHIGILREPMRDSDRTSSSSPPSPDRGHTLCRFYIGKRKLHRWAWINVNDRIDPVRRELLSRSFGSVRSDAIPGRPISASYQEGLAKGSRALMAIVLCPEPSSLCALRGLKRARNPLLCFSVPAIAPRLKLNLGPWTGKTAPNTTNATVEDLVCRFRSGI